MHAITLILNYPMKHKVGYKVRIFCVAALENISFYTNASAFAYFLKYFYCHVSNNRTTYFFYQVMFL